MQRKWCMREIKHIFGNNYWALNSFFAATKSPKAFPLLNRWYDIEQIANFCFVFIRKSFQIEVSMQINNLQYMPNKENQMVAGKIENKCAQIKQIGEGRKRDFHSNKKKCSWLFWRWPVK